MPGKLIKHEFRATGRIMLPVMGVMLILALLANLSVRGLAGSMNDVPALRIVFHLIVVFFVLAMFATVIMALVIMVERFYHNLLRDEGYLMFTLPVSVHELIWSKLIVSLVWFLAAGLLIFLVMAITSLNLANTNLAEIIAEFPSRGQVREFLRTCGVYGKLNGMILQCAVLALLGQIVTCLHFYAAMSLGHMFSKNKVLLSIAFFVLISFAFNIMRMSYGASIGMQIEYTVESYNNANQMLPAITMLSKILGHGLIIELIQGAVLYLATVLGLKRGLNLA